MLKQKSKHIIPVFLTIIVVATAALGNSIASADAIYGQTCSLAVYPFDPNAQELIGAPGTPHLNYLSQANCNNHVSYPNPYNPQPPLPADNPVKAGSENTRVPVAQHDHSYFNDSVQDANYYYKSFVDKFEITLDSDAFDNTINNDLYCITPVPFGYNGNASDLFDCNGSASDLYGGTTVNASYNNAAKKITITWDFGTQSPFKGRPQIFGNNGNAFKVYNDDGTLKATINLTDPYNRDLPFSVTFKTKNNNAQIWSATTNSRVLLGDLALKKTNYPQHFSDGCVNNNVNSASSGWCYVGPVGNYPTESVVTPSGTYSYYWFPIGSVASVWKKPSPPPPKECTNLSVSPTGPFTADQLPKNFTVASTTTGGLQLDYKWTASQPNIITFDGTPNSPFYDTNTNVIVANTQPVTTPLTLTVTAVDKANHNQEFANPCQKTIIINPPPVQECLALNVTPPGPFTDDQLPINFAVTSQTTNGLQLDYKWTVSQNGILATDNIPFTGVPYYDSNQQMIASKLQPVTTPITLTVTGVNKSNHNQEFGGLNSPCQKTVIINPKPILACQSLEIYRNGSAFPPSIAFGTPTNNLTAVIQKDAGLDLDLTWNATSGTFNPPPGQNPLLEPNENALTTFANPSANSPTTVTVVARDASKGPNSAILCQDQFVIQPQLACQSLEIYRNGSPFPASIPAGTPTDNLTVVTQKSAGLDLDFKWNATSGTFDPPPGQNPITKFNENDPTTFANPSLNGITTVTVQAYSAAQGPNSSVLCQDQFVINPAPQQCTALNFQINGGPASNVNNIMEGQTVTLQANPAPQPPFGFVQWQETGNGFFTNVPGAPFICQNALNSQPNFANPGSNISFTAPAFCAYQYTGAVGGHVNVNAYDPNGSSVGNCVASVDVQAQPVNPVCQDLIVNPGILDDSGVTNFNATAVYANGQPNNITLQWTSSGGTYSESNSGSLNQTHPSFQPNFQSTFFANDPYNASVDVQVAGAGSECHAHIPAPVKPVPECSYLNVQENNNQLCIDVDNNYNGSFTWLYGGNPFVTNNSNYCLPLNNVEPGTTVQVYATDAPQNCKDEFEVPIPPPPVIPPTLEKVVSVENQNNYMKTVTVGAQTNGHNTIVDYKLIFTAQSPNTTAAIRDDIAYGIKGTTYPTSVPGGTIVYADSLDVSINECSGNQQNWKNCYTGDISNNTLVVHKVSGQVIIRYKGELRNSAINVSNCQSENAIVCQEKYPNTATAHYTIYDNEDQAVNVGDIESSALVQVFCQYILNRAGGDIFLESDLNAGVNIRVCSKYKTTHDIIVKQAPPPPTHIPSTGLPTEIFSINHEICNEGQAGTLAPGLEEFFGQGVSKLSGMCEVKLTLGKSWKQKTITNSIDENKTRISRWDPTLPEGQGAELSYLFNNVDPGAKVYHVKGANVTVDQPFTLSDGPNGGARTVIVEDGDLIINQDITYGTDGSAHNVNETASLAFIVLNGKIIVAPEVKTMAGVYFAQEGDRPDSGRLFSGSIEGVDSYNQLTVYGSIYGDIDPLFTHRLFAGDPSQEQSSMLIRFDQRIILNTPPGLKDVLSLSQVQVAN